MQLMYDGMVVSCVMFPRALSAGEHWPASRSLLRYLAVITSPRLQAPGVYPRLPASVQLGR